MTAFETLAMDQRIRASIQRDVQSVCTEACHFLGLDITKPAMDLLLDVFFHKMTCYADDLERFAKHAKRSVITSDDCRLLTRRNQTLTTHINSLKLPTSKEPTKRRRTVAVASPAKRPRTVTVDARAETVVGPQINQTVPQTHPAVVPLADRTEPTDTDIDDAIDLTFE